MIDLFPEIRSLNPIVNSKLNLLQILLDELNEGMGMLRAEIMGKKKLTELEPRVFKLGPIELNSKIIFSTLATTAQSFGPCHAFCFVVHCVTPIFSQRWAVIQKIFAHNLPDVANRIVTDHLLKCLPSGRFR